MGGPGDGVRLVLKPWACMVVNGDGGSACFSQVHSGEPICKVVVAYDNRFPFNHPVCAYCTLFFVLPFDVAESRRGEGLDAELWGILEDQEVGGYGGAPVSSIHFHICGKGCGGVYPLDPASMVPLGLLEEFGVGTS